MIVSKYQLLALGRALYSYGGLATSTGERIFAQLSADTLVCVAPSERK